MEEKFNFVKKGYDPVEVNAYIETLEKVLTSYKDKDNAIKNALINAQIAADNIVKNAELEADNIVSKALKLMESLSGSITEQREHVRSFQEEYNALIDKYVHNFNEAEIQKVYDKINELEDYVAKVKENAPDVEPEGGEGAGSGPLIDPPAF